MALWRAVITQAEEDAVANTSFNPTPLESQQARAWLLGSSDDFFEICDLALLDPACVRAAARRKIEQLCTLKDLLT